MTETSKPKPTVWKGVRGTLKFVSVLATFLLLLLAFFVEAPALVLRTVGLERVRGWVLDPVAGYRVTWSKGDVAGEDLGFLRETLRFYFVDLCVRSVEGPRTHACFPGKSEIGFSYDLAAWPPHLERIGPVRAKNGDMSFEPRPSDDAGANESAGLPDAIERAILGPFDIAVESWKLHLPNTEISGRASLRSKETRRGQKGAEVQFTFEERTRQGGAPHASSYQGTLALGDGTLAGDLAARIAGETRQLGEAQDARGHSVLKKKGLGLSVKSRLEVRKPKLAPLEFNWAGILAAPTVEANFDAQGSLRTGLPSGIFSLKTKVKLGGSPGTTARHVGVETKECAFDTQRTEARVLAAFSCPFTFGGRFMTSAATDEVLRALNRGRRFAVNIDFGLSTPDPLSFDEPSQLRLRVEPVQNRTGLRARGFIDTEVTFAPVKFPKAESVSSRLDLFLGIDEFQDLVRELGGGPIAVPAPFRTLRGPLRAEFKGSLFDADRPVQARFVSKLSSRHQKLELESDTRIHVELRDEAKPRVHASGDVLLKRVHLVAPPIDGLPPGQLRPDPRIVLAPDPQPRAQPPRRNDAGFELNYDFRVRTPKDSPMKIAISAAEEPLPVGLEMRFSDSRPLNGTATLGGLNAGVYGIRAELESGRFQFRFSPRSSLIAGGIRAGGENVPFALPQSQTDELIQPDPSFPAPFGEMVSALMAGFPLQVTVREPEFLSPPQNSSLEQGFLLEFRRRY